MNTEETRITHSDDLATVSGDDVQGFGDVSLVIWIVMGTAIGTGLGTALGAVLDSIALGIVLGGAMGIEFQLVGI